MKTVSIPTISAMFDYGASLLTTGNKFLLSGNLWAGKTTLTKGIASWLGIDPNQVQSPTYTYIHIYEEKFLHIDMRRIETEAQLHQLWLIDLIDHYNYVIIERPKWTAAYADTTWQTVDITASPDVQWRIVTSAHWNPSYQITNEEKQ